MNPINQIEYAGAMLDDAQNRIAQMLETTTGKQRGELWQGRWDCLRFLGVHPLYLSQSGQDYFIDNMITEQMRGGIFVDIGGYDGVRGSNSYFFETCRDWDGILIEPVESLYAAASSLRRCRCLNVCVCEHHGPQEFMQVCDGYTQMSGLFGTYEPTMLDRVRSNPDHREQSVVVSGQTLSEILEQEAIETIDCLFMDVEGAEISILRSFPFERFPIRICCIENAKDDGALSDIMHRAGFQLVEYLGVDEIYVHP